MPAGQQHKSSFGHIERQVVLPFGKSLEIAFKSIRVRFVRSMITTLSLVLAVAFLCYTNVTIDVVNGLLATGDADIRQQVTRSGYDVQATGDQVENTPKQRWIVFLSLLVCVVGIVNAQLMSVTERFREIGTMKCLGALDRFILRLFLIEATLQGFIGSTIGAIAGPGGCRVRRTPGSPFCHHIRCHSIWLPRHYKCCLGGHARVHGSGNRCWLPFKSCRRSLPRHDCGKDAAGGSHAGGTIDTRAQKTRF